MHVVRRKRGIVTSHPVSILDNEVTCTCGLRVAAVSATEARRIGSAHVANPLVHVSVLLAFVRLGVRSDAGELMIW